MTWNNLATAQNTNQHLIDVYNNASVVSLENVESSLPVLLSFFTARVQGSKVAVAWATTAEVNSDRFEIRRSSNGVDFNAMATVTAKRNSATKNNYSVFDSNPSAGTNYYQLIQYDIDGKAVVYGIRAINFNSISKTAVKIYPNPFDENSGILLTNSRDKNIKINLVDISGKVIRQREIKTSNGQRYYKLDLGMKPSAGSYILYLQGDAGLKESLQIIIK